MTLSIWRYAHLALAVISSLFLLILSVTGVILAVDAVDEKIPAYRVDNFESLDLAEVIPALRETYSEIIEVTVDHNRFVSIDATDREGNSVKAYIDPATGMILGQVRPKSEFVQWNIALHRSLFLKETGRVIVGVVSFLLFLISVSGTILIVKRQQGVRHFFAKINRDFFAQYFHVVSGRLSLVPVMIIALTGTYLFLIRIEIIGKTDEEVEHPSVSEQLPHREIDEFPVFQDTKLSDVEKIEFPFMEDDPEEFFVLKLRDRALSVHQLNGEIVQETRYAYSAGLEKLSLDLHTGRTNVVWAVILGFASLNILAFIYSGFVITFRRTRTRLKNTCKTADAEIVLLTGSENGSTLLFANRVHQQLLADGKRSYIAEMNQYGIYPKARHLIVFTSTYGLGTAPANATNFGKLLEEIPQQQSVQFTVVGFGSRSYPDFCGFANEVDQVLEQQSWASRYLDLYTVNDKSAEEFVKWVHAWGEKSLIALATAPALYTPDIAGLKKFRVVSKTSVGDDNQTFRVLLKPESRATFQSGDLLAVYPAGDARERFYSIGQRDGMVQLMVKLYPDGLGSAYLYQLQADARIDARIIRNPNFHFPEKASRVAMIANGTGIAPFLGMILNNTRHIPVRLYGGFRFDNELTEHYREFALEATGKNRLESFHIAFSRGETPQYVMDLVRRDSRIFMDMLENNGVIMICGSLKMQRDVEAALESLCLMQNNKTLCFYKDRNQILTDCY